MADKRRRAWAVVLVVFAAGVVVAIGQFKVPPVLPVVMADLGVDMATGGLFMSMVSAASLILAIPSALVLIRLGLKLTGVVALACTVTGAALGALSPTVPGLLLGRLFEGMGISLIGILGPAAISAWFEPQDRGLPMGIWAAWVPLGSVIAFNVAYPLEHALGWQSLWWFGGLCAAIVLVIYALVVADPPPAGATAIVEPQGLPVSLGRRLRNWASWLLAVIFGTFALSTISYNTWAPTYLIEVLGVVPAAASFVASLMFIVGMLGNVGGGLLLNRSSDRYRLLTTMFLITTVLFAGSFSLGSVGVTAVFISLLGVVGNTIPTIVFTLAPETMEDLRFAGLGLAIAMMGSSIGTLVGPPLLGKALSGGTWTLGSVFLVAVMSVGLVACVIAWRWERKRQARELAPQF
jgi:predicted MFS family arabinose efflux permease